VADGEFHGGAPGIKKGPHPEGCGPKSKGGNIGGDRVRPPMHRM
jgi:hypothetical protein